MQLSEFFAARKPATNQFFSPPGGKGKTVLVSSHIYWTDLIAHALLCLGYNVLLAEPWYWFWMNQAWQKDFDAVYDAWIAAIRQNAVICIIGGNTTAMVPHVRTREPLHRAAGVPVVHYWWDEPRTAPLMNKFGVSLADYVSLLRDERTLNVLWDQDVMRELSLYWGLDNMIHCPLATTPQFWNQPFVPMQDRAKSACFLGNCHFLSQPERDGLEPDLVAWAQAVVALRSADPGRSIPECVDLVGQQPKVDTTDDAALRQDFRRWFILNYFLVESQRGNSVKAMASRLGDAFTLVGADWDKVGLTASAKHSGVPHAGNFYASHKASLNLYGGCVHSGMPLRPFDIASANGLVFTHYNRELPDLFEPGKQCVAFSSEQQMLEQLDRVLSHPQDFNAVVQAGHQRMLQSHTWQHRMQKVMQEVGERFGIEV